MLFLVGLIAFILVSIYTISYGVYEWKNNNKTGAVAVFTINLATIMLVVLRMFIKI